ncbi:hypothetical protein F5877DRAFT_85563 [Lentinula edodes]|nr:hypothetical protein F5877DRAFT_85563 [Lentinula edodes]
MSERVRPNHILLPTQLKRSEGCRITSTGPPYRQFTNSPFRIYLFNCVVLVTFLALVYIIHFYRMPHLILEPLKPLQRSFVLCPFLPKIDKRSFLRKLRRNMVWCRKRLSRLGPATKGLDDAILKFATLNDPPLFMDNHALMSSPEAINIPQTHNLTFSLRSLCIIYVA